jgi:hypothetical protein
MNGFCIYASHDGTLKASVAVEGLSFAFYTCIMARKYEIVSRFGYGSEVRSSRAEKLR